MGAELMALAAMLLAASGVFLGLSAIKRAKALELRICELEEAEG
jgi:hypothetical protein